MKKILTLLTMILFASFTIPAQASRKPVPTPIPPTIPYSVCIDAGHGGASEPGAIYRDPVTGEIVYKESEINLRTALLLKEGLVGAGYLNENIFMTRIVDTAMTNEDRYDYCNSKGAAILVSIHHNGSIDPTINYSKSLYMKEADVPLAHKVVDAVSVAMGLENKGISRFPSGVLLKSLMPATISEGFFLTSENVVKIIEEGGLVKETGGLVKAINSWFYPTL